VKDVSIADASEQVKASTNPRPGQAAGPAKKQKGPQEYVIRAVLGEESGPGVAAHDLDPHHPVVVGDRRSAT